MALAASERYMSEAAATSPSHAAVILYDEAIAALKSAVVAIACGDVDARCNAVQSVTETVTTLYLNLDVKRSGEIADSLANLYGYVLGRLMRVNMYNDAGIAEELIDLLEPLRNSWANLEDVISARPAAKGKPVNGKAGNGKAGNGKVANGKAANGKAANGKAGNGKALPIASGAAKPAKSRPKRNPQNPPISPK
jgi:flagellar protein FliS